MKCVNIIKFHSLNRDSTVWGDNNCTFLISLLQWKSGDLYALCLTLYCIKAFITVKSRFNESRFNVKSRFKEWNLMTEIKFHIKKSRFNVKSRFKEWKGADGGHSLNRDFTVLWWTHRVGQKELHFSLQKCSCLCRMPHSVLYGDYNYHEEHTKWGKKNFTFHFAVL